MPSILIYEHYPCSIGYASRFAVLNQLCEWQTSPNLSLSFNTYRMHVQKKIKETPCITAEC